VPDPSAPLEAGPAAPRVLEPRPHDQARRRHYLPEDRPGLALPRDRDRPRHPHGRGLVHVGADDRRHRRLGARDGARAAATTTPSPSRSSPASRTRCATWGASRPERRPASPWSTTSRANTTAGARTRRWATGFRPSSWTSSSSVRSWRSGRRARWCRWQRDYARSSVRNLEPVQRRERAGGRGGPQRPSPRRRGGVSRELECWNKGAPLAATFDKSQLGGVLPFCHVMCQQPIGTQQLACEIATGAWRAIRQLLNGREFR
jgi:hypothetical protein